jgi:hypothetical protein
VKILQGYLKFLNNQYEKNVYTPFSIKTSQDYAKPDELLTELEAKGLARVDVGMVEMLDSNFEWHITVRQSCVALFRKICPWQITSGDSGEMRDRGKLDEAERKV